MKMLILSGVILLSAAVSEAAGKNEAFAICRGIADDFYNTQCTNKIRKYDYYDRAAINTCVSISDDHYKSNCVDAIGDKTFEKFETESCASKSDGFWINDCLKKAGKKYSSANPPPQDDNYGCISKHELQRELSRLERLVQYNDNGRALQLLRRLQYDVSCN